MTGTSFVSEDSSARVERDLAAGVQRRSQMRACALHPALHTGNREAESLSRLNLRQAVELNQLKRLLIGSTELADQRPQARAELLHCSGLFIDIHRFVTRLLCERKVGSRASRHLALVSGSTVVVDDGPPSRLVDPRVKPVRVS